MKFDTKIKIVLWEGLKPWQALNVTAFLMSGIAGTQEIIGKPYVDAEGHQYLPMSQQPIMNSWRVKRAAAGTASKRSVFRGPCRIHLYRRVI